MPSVAHEPMTNGVDSTPKEKTFDLKSKAIHNSHNSSGFTAVNSSNSTSPTRREYVSNGYREGQNSVRSGSEEDQKLPMSRPGDNWAHTNGYHSERGQSVTHGRRGSSTANKRKRSDSDASSSSEEQSFSGQARHRNDSYGSSTSPRSTQGAHNGHIALSREPHHSSGYEFSKRNPRDRSGTLRSESNMADDSQRDRSDNSPGKTPAYSNGDESANAQATQGEGSSTTEITRAGVQVDPKKRKRQFANRTKTGCQTCRRRKKKCDETKPECSNCIRGGFVCEGYNQKSQWKQPSNPRPPMPLVSKEAAFENQAPMYPRPPTHAAHPEYEPHPTSQDRGSRRPILVDDGERQPAARQWGGWNDAPPAERRSYTHPLSTEYAPPSQELRGPPIKTYQEPVPMPQPAPVHSYSQPHPNASTNTQMPMSLHRPPQSQPQPPPPPESDKDKMLRGEQFLLFAPQLLEEREQCKSALWRFNNSQDPGRGVTREERSRLFRSVLEAPYIRRGPGYPPAPIGTVGRDVHVDAPFNCEYGYNINIGDNVVIGSNCTVQDPCRITIGARTIIGPNVNILGMTVPCSPKGRNGSKGIAYGMEIRIEEDVFIGGGVTIVPRKGGIIIGKGSTVGAGSVVTKDVPRHTVSAGNPSRVLRGIWEQN